MPIRNFFNQYNDNYPQGILYDADINRSTKRKRALSNENVNKLKIVNHFSVCITRNSNLNGILRLAHSIEQLELNSVNDEIVCWFIENIKTFPNITSISLHCLSAESTDKLLFTISELILSQTWFITSFDLSDNVITDDQFEYILESLSFNQCACALVERLILHNNRLSGKTLIPLTNLISKSYFPRLSDYSINGNCISVTDFEKIMNALKNGNCQNIPYMKVVYEASKDLKIENWCRNRLRTQSFRDLNTLT